VSPIVGSSLLGEYRASDELPGETLGDPHNFRIPRHPGSTAIGLVSAGGDRAHAEPEQT